MRVATTCLALLLAGCAALPPAPTPASWEERHAELLAIEHWSLSGRVAVATAADGYSGSFAWQQAGDSGQIDLRGPLGAGALRLTLVGGDIRIRDGDGEEISGDEATRFLQRQIGAALPVGQLRYWIRGIPAPGLAHQLLPGGRGQLAGLVQAGWQVRYDAYDLVGTTLLPGRLQLQSGDVRVRLLVRSWRLDP